MNKSSALLYSLLLCTLLITSCDEPKAEEPQKSQQTDNENKGGTSTTYTFKPANKYELVAEIKKAMKEHGNEADLNYIDTSEIQDMESLFDANDYDDSYGLGAFNGDISQWDVSKVTDMSYMFQRATTFNQDISGWNVGKVYDMSFMFDGATAFNQDISKWQIGSVIDMGRMFYGATAFKYNIDSWKSRLLHDITGLDGALEMFSYSGLAKSLPSWCTRTCKDYQ